VIKREREELVVREIDPNKWMVTFSDLLTLLLTFFVLLLTMKSMDIKSFQESFGTAVPKPGILTQGGSTDLVRPNIVPAVERNPLEGSGASEITTDLQAYHELLALLATLREAQDAVIVEITEEGISVRFMAHLTFETDSDVLRPEAVRTLNALAPLLARLRFPMIIEGHVAEAPGGSGDRRAQMSLSLRRSHAVLMQLARQADTPVPESKFTMIGRGAHRQAEVPPGGADGRLHPTDPRNSRVEILIQTRIKAFNI
jgi:chemotaxis protein MotB